MLTYVRVDPRPVGAARVALAAAAAMTSLEGAAIVSRLVDDRISTPVAAWLPSAEAMPVLLWLATAFVACACLLFGIAAAPSALAIAAANTLLLATDQQLYSNHRVLLVLLCLWFAFAGSDRAFAVGARARRDRSGARVPWWPQLLVLATVSSCYVFAGLSKLNPEFLSGDLIASMSPDWVPAAALAWATVPTEVAIGLGLLFGRTRAPAIVLGLGLHVSIVLLLGEPFIFLAFALLCLTAYPLPAIGRDLRPEVPAYPRATRRAGTVALTGDSSEAAGRP